MDTPTVIAVVGGISLLIGSLGGNLKIKALIIPKLQTNTRILAGGVGVVLISLSVWLSTYTAKLGSQPPISTLVPNTVDMAATLSFAQLTVTPVTKTFTIQADQGWFNTGIILEKGERVEVEYSSGLWSVTQDLSSNLYDADGAKGDSYYVCAQIQAGSVD